MRKNYIIATAGHIDHGKTSLIKALTGKDCDTHPEEKKRGITIHLGFSHLELDDGIHAGIVDVPGHKDFIDTMISGINGIDLVLFIVATDEGFMPQTSEHLQILNMLGVRKGLVLLTKSDLVDEETIYLATEEIKEKTAGTFLENAKVITTSTVSGQNIETLKAVIKEELVSSSQCPDDINSTAPCQLSIINYQLNNSFRLYPDRFFSIKGFGSVITGTALSGDINKNTTLYAIPTNKEIKIRRMEAYGKETDTVSAGQRASLNITNFTKEDFTNGVMLSDQTYHTTSLIDVELQLFSDVPPLSLWTTCEFYTSTIQTQARIHLMDKDKLYANEKCFAQLHLDKAIPVCYGDKFIVRNSCGEITIGGGTIIDAFPLHHRRRTKKVKDLIQMRNSGNITDLVCTEIEKTMKPISIEQIFKKMGWKNAHHSSLITLNSIDRYLQHDNWFWLKPEQEKLEKRIVRYLQVAHKHNPIDPHGKPFEEFTSMLADFPEASRPIIVRAALDSLITAGTVEQRDKTFALTTHKVSLQHNDYVQINWVDQYILNQRMHTPLWSDILERATQKEIDEKRLKQIIFYLVNRGRIVHYDGEYLHSHIVDATRKKLLNYLNDHPEGCTVADFRNLIDGNRKICLILLNIFDREGITTRIDDYRFITEKGKRVLLSYYSV